MKLIITEHQLKLIIENEDVINPDGELFEMPSDIVSPFKWDKTFLRACKLEPGKYRGYYINGDVNLFKSDITELNYLVKVGGNLNLKETQIKELPMLSKVGGNLYLNYRLEISYLTQCSLFNHKSRLKLSIVLPASSCVMFLENIRYS